MLLRGVPDIIRYLGRAVMAATTDEFLTPYIELAESGELTRAIGPEFVAELNQQLEDGSITGANQDALTHVQKVIAWYAYSRYLPFAIGNDGDNGLQEVGTESTAPVRIGVLDKRIRATEKNAVESLEALLQLLEHNPADYPTYNGSATAIRTRSLFLPSATAMSTFLPIINRNYRLYVNLRPYIELAERDFILPRLGQVQYDALKAKLISRDPDVKELKLIFILGRALAHTAFWLALPNLQFEVLSSGSVRVTSDFDGIYNRKSAPADTINYLVAAQQTESKKHLNALTSFLRKNLNDYPLYAESKAADNQTPNRLPDNSQYTKVFRMR